jgi:hypothetical protein
MRAHLNLHIDRPRALPLPGAIHRLASVGDPGDGDTERRALPPDPTEREDLPYKVELWNEAKTSVEQVLAVTANGSIGYAAFYGATREFPHRYITLRHKSRIVSRWNGPQH